MCNIPSAMIAEIQTLKTGSRPFLQSHFLVVSAAAEGRGLSSAGSGSSQTC